MSAHGSEPLRLRGTPLSLSIAMPGPAAGPPRLALDLAKAGAVAKGGPLSARAVHADAGGGVALLRVEVSRSTPPGTYHGTIEIGDDERPVVVEVEADPFLRMFPERLLLEGPPGGRLDVELTLANLGNVAVDVAAVHAFGVFELGGVERAIRRGFAEEPPEGQRRIDTMVDRVAESHGGLVRVKMTEGAGTLEPVETHRLRAVFVLPDRLRPGSVYSGTWPLDYLRHYVRIVCTAPDTEVPR